MKLFKNNSTFILSFTAHLFILTLMVFQFTSTKQKLKLGESEVMLTSYIYQENIPVKVRQEIHKIPTPKQTPKTTEISKKGLSTVKKNPVLTKKNDVNPVQPKNISTPEQSQKAGNGNPTSELVTLLHAAIQAQQKYPDNALQMEREGKTTLSFTLYPDGSIKSLKMLNSSGTSTLDEAALTAVNAATPFKGIDKYLKNPEEFQITVAFELT